MSANTAGGSASGVSVTLPPGDVNGDNAVDGDDTALLRAHFNTVSGGAGFSASADLNGDGVVDGNDTALLRAHFNTVGAPAGAPAAPPAPLVEASAAGSTGALVKWCPVGGASSYDLYRATTPGGEGATPYRTGVGNTWSGGLYFGESGLAANTTYYYRVVAVGAGGAGTPSGEASLTTGVMGLPAPGGLTATYAPNGGQSIALAWGAVSGATSYDIYRGTGGAAANSAGGGAGTPTPLSGSPEVLYATGVTGTSFTDANVAYGTTYYYYLVSVTTAGAGPQSGEADATLFGFGVTPGPASLTVSRGSVGAVGVTLTPSGGYAWPVSLGVAGLPSGTSYLCYPSPTLVLSTVELPEYTNPVPEGIYGTVSTNLVIAVPLSAPPGTYQLQITGTGPGATNGATVALTVN